MINIGNKVIFRMFEPDSDDIKWSKEDSLVEGQEYIVSSTTMFGETRCICLDGFKFWHKERLFKTNEQDTDNII
jgi:hypothetical protein